MPANKNLLILPGDGIGVETMAQVRRVIDWMDKHRTISFDISEGLIGGAAYDVHGTPLADSTNWRTGTEFARTRLFLKRVQSFGSEQEFFASYPKTP